MNLALPVASFNDCHLANYAHVLIGYRPCCRVIPRACMHACMHARTRLLLRYPCKALLIPYIYYLPTYQYAHGIARQLTHTNWLGGCCAVCVTGHLSCPSRFFYCDLSIETKETAATGQQSPQKSVGLLGLGL